jgi:hypothetical protein
VLVDAEKPALTDRGLGEGTPPPLPRVLFLSPRREDYLADGILHGLRALLGDRVVDHPKHEVMYRLAGERALPRIRGGGFTLYSLLDDIPIDRSRTLDEARWGEFDLVVVAAIKDSFGLFVEMFGDMPDTQVAVLDGDDHPSMYPYRRAWWTRPQWWFLPRAHTRFPYFKRELTPLTYHYRCFRLLPSALAHRLPILKGVRPTAFSVPEEKICDGPAEKSQLFARDIVDPELKDCAPTRTQADYLFRDEAEYYADIRRSSFGITLKRGGWDCLRHYEIAANGTVPCFRDLGDKPELCAPHGLRPGTNCLSYRSRTDLLAQIDRLSDADYERLRQGALQWARDNSTIERARELLAAFGWHVPRPT